MNGRRENEEREKECLEDGAKVDIRVNNFNLERLENCGKRGWKMLILHHSYRLERNIH